MGIKGKMTKDKMGMTVPVDAPMLPHKYYGGNKLQMWQCEYETDADAAAALIPDCLTLADPPIAALGFNHYPSGTLGSDWNEAVMYVNVLFKDQPMIIFKWLSGLSAITPLHQLYGMNYLSLCCSLNLHLAGTTTRDQEMRIPFFDLSEQKLPCFH